MNEEENQELNEQDINKLVEVRREKLFELQNAGQDP